MIIKNALIFDAVSDDPFLGDILTAGGKIARVIRKEWESEPDAGTLAEYGNDGVIDAGGMRVYPGLVDAHSHIGLDGHGGSTGGTQDYNEYNDPVTPQLRGMDSYNPRDGAIPAALAGGVTTVCTGPGSSNVIGGTATVVKLVGNTLGEALLIPEAAMKCAFGENPKRCYKDRSNSARMSTAAKLREALFSARDYMLRKEAAGGDITKMPKFDMKAESLMRVLKGELPLKAHAHRADDIMTAIRIAGEFGVSVTVEHCTEGNLIKDELKAAGVRVAVGPTLSNVSKPELINKSWTTPGVLASAGIPVSIITDAPVIPQEYLPLCAGLAVKAGMSERDALRAITVNAARHIGADGRVGSLEEGKDADIVISSGNILHSESEVITVIVNGKVAYRKG